MWGQILKSPSETAFDTWGKYEGSGMHLRGKMLGVAAGGVRIFSHSTDELSFIAVEFYHDEDLNNLRPGFELVASTFELIK